MGHAPTLDATNATKLTILCRTALYQPRKRKRVYKRSRRGLFNCFRCSDGMFPRLVVQLRGERRTHGRQQGRARTQGRIFLSYIRRYSGVPTLRQPRDYAILRVFFSTLLMV